MLRQILSRTLRTKSISTKVCRANVTPLLSTRKNHVKKSLELKPHLDFRFFRDNVDQIAKVIKDRQAEADIHKVAALYEKQMNKLKQVEQLRSRRNKIAEEMKRKDLDPATRQKYVEEGKTIKTTVTDLDKELDTLQTQLLEEGLKVPNLYHPDIPIGGEDAAKVIKTFGTKPAFDFEAKDHLELAKHLSLLDFETGSVVSGAKFYYSFNEAAQLELALANWAMNKVTSKGFIPVITPDIVRDSIAEGCGFAPRSQASQTYFLADHDQCLIGTSEIPLAGMYFDQIIPNEHLPLKFVAFSHCFRAETGAGQHSRGLYRVHQFSKVEMFVFGRPEESQALHEELLNIQTEILSELGLHCRVLDMPSGDLGASAYRKYDIEAWMPSKNGYGEVTSASNCTDYQSRRLNIRFRRTVGAQSEYVHTLNGTALAVPRVVLTILESNQQADGTINIPAPLVPYMGGKTKIVPKQTNHITARPDTTEVDSKKKDSNKAK
jgi:seryl-tRNA synthetase